MQFYIKKDEKTLEVCLIDLYHLAIDAKNFKIGRYDLPGRYNVHKKCQYDISNIVLELKNELHIDNIY